VPVRIGVQQGIVQTVSIEIPTLRIVRVRKRQWLVRAGKSPLCPREVPCPKIVEAGLSIPFFAGVSSTKASLIQNVGYLDPANEHTFFIWFDCKKNQSNLLATEPSRPTDSLDEAIPPAVDSPLSPVQPFLVAIASLGDVGSVLAPRTMNRRQSPFVPIPRKN
jgi:hypothetical protein